MPKNALVDLLDADVPAIQETRRPMTIVRLFVDFDGVLRRLDSPAGALEPELVQRLENCVLSHAHLRVVISSTWRHAMPVAALRKLFSPALAERIEGVTPDRSLEEDEVARHAEVLAYLRGKQALAEPWLAIDDQAENFAADASVLILDGNRGFDEDAVQRVFAWVAKLTPKDVASGELDFVSGR